MKTLPKGVSWLAVVATCLAAGACTPVTPSPSPTLTTAPPTVPPDVSFEVARNWETWCTRQKLCSLTLEGPDGQAWAVSRAAGSTRYTVMNGGMPKSLMPGDYKLSFHGAETIFIGTGFSSPTPFDLEFDCAAEFAVGPLDTNVLATIERADRRDCAVEVQTENS